MINTNGSNLRDHYRHYWIWFENAERMSARVSENDQLYYTDNPPAAGGIPLTINDIPQTNSGGKKTKKYRKKNKKYRTIVNKKNKKRNLKNKSKK